MTPILGKPWVEGSSDPAVGLDCAGVVTWVMRQLGVPEDELPEWPGTAQHQADPREVKRCAAMWQPVHLRSKMRVGDVVTTAPHKDTARHVPHLLVVVSESPLRVASSVERDGVIVKAGSRIVAPTGVYRWPAAARIVGAPTEELA